MKAAGHVPPFPGPEGGSLIFSHEVICHMPRKKKSPKIHWKQLLLSVIALVLACFILLLLNQAMGEQLPLPTAREVSAYLSGLLDELYGTAGIAPAPADVEGELVVHFLDVGQADCILIQTEEQNVLIDAGETGCGEFINAYLDAQGVKTLDLIIATHAHADHIGSMSEVIEQFDVGKIIMSDIPAAIMPTSRTYETLLDTIASHGLHITRAVPGAEYSLGGGATLTILGPLEEYNDLNDTSVTCRVVYGENAFLFTGDAEQEYEADLLKRYPKSRLAADVLKLGHHGSNTSSHADFLDTVGPEIAVAMVGLDNSYGHPHAETLQALAERGIALYRTDEDGTVVIASDGETLTVSTEKQAA